MRNIWSAAIYCLLGVSVAHAANLDTAKIEQLTGLQRGQTQVRQFLKGLGLKWQRIRAIPVPPKKTWRSMSPIRPCFMTPN